MANKLKPQQIGEKKRAGGWRGSPNSIASLFRWQVPYADQRKCKRCRAIAVRGSDYCRRHGDWIAPTDAAGRAESRLLARLEYIGLLPLELIALPVWRGLNGLSRADRAPLRLALLQAWDKRDEAPLRWAQVQRQAIEAGRQADPEFRMSFWEANR